MLISETGILWQCLDSVEHNGNGITKKKVTLKHTYKTSCCRFWCRISSLIDLKRLLLGLQVLSWVVAVEPSQQLSCLAWSQLHTEHKVLPLLPTERHCIKNSVSEIFQTRKKMIVVMYVCMRFLAHSQILQSKSNDMIRDWMLKQTLAIAFGG